LGIDEINKVHEINEKEFKKLFNMIGGLSSSSPIFFMPILAGTVVGPVQSAVSKSMHPPCHVPLPLLSLNSCERILKAKIPTLDTEDARFKQVLSDIGGHCRSLEYLYDAILKINPNLQDHWLQVSFNVRERVNATYSVGNAALGQAIAKAFLSIPVGCDSRVFEGTSYVDLEEAGLIKLEPKDNLFIIKIPFVFVWCHMQRRFDENKYYKFWYELLIRKDDIGWQKWEVFNQNYIAFRLSLYSFLGHQTVSLREFFDGAVSNIPVNTIIKIPSIEDITTSVCPNRYPFSSKETQSLKIGDCVLNASGSPFDAFVWLSTTSSSSSSSSSSSGKILLAMQMKYSQLDASTSAIDNRLIDEEYKKVNDSVAKYLPGSDFVFLMLCRRDGNIDHKLLPSKTVVVSKSELLAFYGDSYYQRLEK
jgi:hypothetical protein